MKVKKKINMVSLIVAKSKNNVIGKGNSIPWDLPMDTEYFRRVIHGYPIIMGRNTAVSLGQRLSGSTNIVISGKDIVMEGFVVVHSLKEAIELAKKEDDDIFVIGGERVYAEALKFVDMLYITEVDTVIDNGEVFFPNFDKSLWIEKKRKKQEANSDNAYSMDFVVYERKKV